MLFRLSCLAACPNVVRPFAARLITVGLSFVLLGCGGGGDSLSLHSTVTLSPDAVADAGLARFNAARAALGLSVLTRDPALDAAARGHSEYQAANGVITHYQTAGTPGFTGECLGDSAVHARCAPEKTSRLEQAGYLFSDGGHAFGEVISKTFHTSAADAADALIAAIYHRFVIFEPVFKQAGTGAAQSVAGATYFTVNLVADGLDGGLGLGNVVVYPMNGQQDVPRSFSSDQEVPDPVPSRDMVGYPISIHADIHGAMGATVVDVDRFLIRPLGGTALSVQALWRGKDAHTPASVAAIVPLEILAPQTTYEVEFVGTVSGRNVSRVWQFTTGL